MKFSCNFYEFVHFQSSPPVIDSANSARDRVQKLLEKNQRRSGDSQNGSAEGEVVEGEVVKPAAMSARPSMNEQAISNENKLEDVASLTEADKQALEDAKGDEKKDESGEATVNGLENSVNEDAAINKNVNISQSSYFVCHPFFFQRYGIFLFKQ